MTVRLMSDAELRRLEVLRDLDQRRLTSAAAAQLLGRKSDDGLVSFHLKRLLNGVTGSHIVFD